MNRIARLGTFFGVAACCLAMSACNRVERIPQSNATLEGTITYKGKPVPYALVVASGQGASATTNVENDGKYKMEHVPLGQVKIGVNTEAGRGMMMSQMMASKKGAAPKPEFVEVPKKFHEPGTSGLTTTISDGPNTLDIKLD